MTTTNRPIFEESQSFRDSPPVRWIVGGVTLICVLMLVFIILSGEWLTMSGEERFFSVLTSILVPAINLIGMRVLRLRTLVLDEGLYLHFRTLRRRHILFGQIVSAERTTYHPIRDYGGWGIRLGGHKKSAYNVMGNEGVLLHLKDGGTFLIGSQRSAELEAALNKAIGRRSTQMNTD